MLQETLFRKLNERKNRLLSAKKKFEWRNCFAREYAAFILNDLKYSICKRSIFPFISTVEIEMEMKVNRTVKHRERNNGRFFHFHLDCQLNWKKSIGWTVKNDIKPWRKRWQIDSLENRFLEENKLRLFLGKRIPQEWSGWNRNSA